MVERKFKIGDRVKIVENRIFLTETNTEISGDVMGKIGVIESFLDVYDNSETYYNISFENNSILTVAETSLELVEEEPEKEKNKISMEITVGADFKDVDSGIITLFKDYNMTTRSCLKFYKIEYGEIVGSIGWAYKEAEVNGEVWREGFRYVIFNEELCYFDNQNGVCVSVCEKYLTGWYRKEKTDKEKLLDEIRGCYNSCDYEIESILDKYEINLKNDVKKS